jgi:hypothetical protein
MADIVANIDGGTPAAGETSPGGEIGAILLLVYNQLKDEFGFEYPPSKILPYFDLFCAETVNLVPESYPVEDAIVLVSGARQTLPADAISLIDVLYNVTGSGTTELATTAVKLINKNNLDSIFPGWPSSPASATVLFVAVDSRNPKVFYTYPPQPSSSMGSIKVLLSELPDPITVDTEDFPFDDSYKPACVDYLIYRCLIEETTIPNAQAKATSFYNKYLTGLGMKDKVSKRG